GMTKSFGNWEQAYLVRTYPNGTMPWQESFGGFVCEAAESVQQTGDGGFIFTGLSNSGGTGSKLYLVKTDAKGRFLWEKYYGTGATGYAILRNSDGGFMVAGTIEGTGGWPRAYLLKTSSAGEKIWHRVYGGPYLDTAFSLRKTSDGGYIMAGDSTSFGKTRQVLLIKTDAGGNTMWRRTFGRDDWDTGYSVQQTRDGGYIVAGYSFRSPRYDQIYLIKTDASGKV
ncbi:MAG: hypothetical protein LUQ25_03550, partial [Methanoregulaceae archaeon]|nr:hypothetical protein [Methanoregulaceae archaeon]